MIFVLDKIRFAFDISYQYHCSRYILISGHSIADTDCTDCCRTYSDSCFSVLCRARHGYLLQLQVLEAVCQRIHKPNLCVQKDSVIALKLFK